MPSKKQQPFMYSIDPELYRRSHAPSSTIAMGMKPSQASCLCWGRQVAREQTLRERWEQQYDPAGSQRAAATDALQRTLARDKLAKERYLGAGTNPELHAILYGSAKDGDGPGNATGHAGHSAAAAAVSPDGGDAESVFADLQKRKVKPSVKYLEARRAHYTVSQRYPAGPMTSNQCIGWAAAAAEASGADDAAGRADSRLRSTAELYRPARQRATVQAYRKPEDDDHALLFGYDFQPK